MSELVERAIETARNATPAVQEEAARLLLRFLGEDQAVYELAPTEVASLTEARAGDATLRLTNRSARCGRNTTCDLALCAEGARRADDILA